MAETIVDLRSVVKHFESLPDPRHGINRLRLLGDVIAMAVYPTEEKSNEITVIPELIDQLDVKDAVVTIDAMGCQRKIAKKIADSQADYVPAVNENQPKLHGPSKMSSVRIEKTTCYECKFGNMRRPTRDMDAKTSTAMCRPRSRTISQ